MTQGFKTFNGKTISRSTIVCVFWGHGFQATRINTAHGYSFDVTADEEPALAEWIGVEYPPAPPRETGDSRAFLLDFLEKSGFDNSGTLIVPPVRNGLFGTENLNASERIVDAFFDKRRDA